jgi:hypothetical protein
LEENWMVWMAWRKLGFSNWTSPARDTPHHHHLKSSEVVSLLFINTYGSSAMTYPSLE